MDIVMLNRKDFFTSGWEFSEDEADLKSTFQMINIAILLSSFGLIVGIIGNIIKDISGFIPLELTLLGINMVLLFLLRKNKELLNVVAFVETAQFTFLFLFLIYTSQPEHLKHIWIFTYPIVLLYFQDAKNAKYWVAFMMVMLIVAPLQPFVAVAYSKFQATYIAVVLFVISIIIYFYQRKMSEAKETILWQRERLQQQVEELTQKDKLLTIQSKQAVMGEMISMIAHQWRQPLSTVTLSISDLQLKRMLNVTVDDSLMEKKLQEISDTVLYLSETIDDFQTYFAPNKSMSEVSIGELIDRAINFIKPRLRSAAIEIVYEGKSDVNIQTYSNEFVQVLLNIINNAIDELITTTHKKEKIIKIGLQEQTDDFLLFIEDNGRGIAPESINSIFEPYYSTKGKNGTGLGLYMSQMIMQKQFNSKIEVSSQSVGTRFSIRVPKKLT